MSEKEFKSCTNCLQSWGTIDEFLEDSEVEILGYQAGYGEVKSGTFLFNHETCTGTFAMYVTDFSQLKTSPAYIENKSNKNSYPNFCLHRTHSNPCQDNCECHWVQDVIQTIRDWKK